MRVYVSGALTDAPDVKELKRLYEEIAMLCRGLGLEPYVPHMNSDPTQHPDITPEAVYGMDRHQVEIADLVIAYVGAPSLGVGIELEIASRSKIPIILLYEQGKRISRMARGEPTVIQHIVFTDYIDSLTQLQASLEQLIANA